MPSLRPWRPIRISSERPRGIPTGCPCSAWPPTRRGYSITTVGSTCSARCLPTMWQRIPASRSLAILRQIIPSAAPLGTGTPVWNSSSLPARGPSLSQSNLTSKGNRPGRSDRSHSGSRRGPTAADAGALTLPCFLGSNGSEMGLRWSNFAVCGCGIWEMIGPMRPCATPIATVWPRGWGWPGWRGVRCLFI